VKVPTTLNSVSTDRQRWKALGVPERYAQNSIALGDAYLELGCQPSFTCAPYLLPCPPRLGDDIAWGESNAVVYANSVLGARTEKYADYLDICCALTGFVPAAGVHLAANRLPGIVLDATDLLTTVEELVGAADVDMVFPILGHLCGALSDGKVPILVGLEKWAGRITPDNLKAFCAAFGTTGSSPLIHIAGITPEAENESDVRRLLEGCGDVTRVVSRGLFEETIRTLDSGGGGGALDDDRVQLVALGNPHLSTTECETLSELVTAVGLPKSPDVRVVACISRDVLKSANERHVDTLTRWGVEFVNDTCWCMLLDPPVIPAKRTSKILTNSGKYSHYGPGLTNRAFRFGSLEDCIRTATTGRYASLRQSKICRSASSPFASTTRQLSMHAFYVVHNAIRRWR
jgi:cis-L-3-hydroxyproline dehydratase